MPDWNILEIKPKKYGLIARLRSMWRSPEVHSKMHEVMLKLAEQDRVAIEALQQNNMSLKSMYADMSRMQESANLSIKYYPAGEGIYFNLHFTGHIATACLLWEDIVPHLITHLADAAGAPGTQVLLKLAVQNEIDRRKKR